MMLQRIFRIVNAGTFKNLNPFVSRRSINSLFKIMNEEKGRKRKRLSIDDKVTIINRLHAGESSHTLTQDYGINPSTLRNIKRNKENIVRQHRILKEQHGSTHKKKITNIEESAFEKAIYNWFVQQRTLGQPISQTNMAEKALTYHRKIFGAESKFKASNGWLHRFKQRHGIRSLATQKEHLSADSVGSNEFVETFTTFLEENEYSLDQVYNADETSLLWNTLPLQTLAGQFESSTQSRRVIKDRVTVMICANATGSHKIPLLMIGKSKKPQCLKNVENLPVIYKDQESAWMDRDLFQEWYKEVFLPNVKGKHGSATKCLLLLDNAPSHPSIDLLNSIDNACQIMYIPPNETSLIQPMDQGVIIEMKNIYRKQVLRALLIEDDEVNTVSFLRKFNLTDCCTYINNAWSSLTETNLSKAWNKILANGKVSSDVSVSFDEEELIGMLQKIPGCENISIEETRKWLEEDAIDPGWRCLTDTEIINSISKGIIDDTDAEELDIDEFKLEEINEDGNVSPKEALDALKKLYRYVECNWKCTSQHICNLSSIRSVIESDIYSRKIDCQNLEDDGDEKSNLI